MKKPTALQHYLNRLLSFLIVKRYKMVRNLKTLISSHVQGPKTSTGNRSVCNVSVSGSTKWMPCWYNEGSYWSIRFCKKRSLLSAKLLEIITKHTLLKLFISWFRAHEQAKLYKVRQLYYNSLNRIALFNLKF